MDDTVSRTPSNVFDSDYEPKPRTKAEKKWYMDFIAWLHEKYHALQAEEVVVDSYTVTDKNDRTGRLGEEVKITLPRASLLERQEERELLRTKRDTGAGFTPQAESQLCLLRAIPLYESRETKEISDILMVIKVTVLVCQGYPLGVTEGRGAEWAVAENPYLSSTSYTTRPSIFPRKTFRYLSPEAVRSLYKKWVKKYIAETGNEKP